MQFLHQPLTWAFFLVLVPLLIHLINLMRHRRVEWAAMEFLLEARQSEDVELLFLDDAGLDPLRDDPRFVELVRSMNLPEEIYLNLTDDVSGDSESF